MNTYYIRCLPSDWRQLLNLGEKLGAIEQHFAAYEEVKDPDGNIVARNPLGKPTITATQGGVWDFIGTIQKPTGVTETLPDGTTVMQTTTVADPNGVAYWHVNLVTPVSLWYKALELEASDAEIAEALANLHKFFMLDDQGMPRLPAEPVRVFAGLPYVA